MPLGPRKVLGVVWGPGEGRFDRAKLRRVIRVLDVAPMKSEMQEFLTRAGDYTLTPMPAMLRLATRSPGLGDPPSMRSVYRMGDAEPDRMTDARAKVIAVLEESLARRLATELEQGAVFGLLGHADAADRPLADLPRKFQRRESLVRRLPGHRIVRELDRALGQQCRGRGALERRECVQARITHGLLHEDAGRHEPGHRRGGSVALEHEHQLHAGIQVRRRLRGREVRTGQLDHQARRERALGVAPFGVGQAIEQVRMLLLAVCAPLGQFNQVGRGERIADRRQPGADLVAEVRPGLQLQDEQAVANMQQVVQRLLRGPHGRFRGGVDAGRGARERGEALDIDMAGGAPGPDDPVLVLTPSHTYRVRWAEVGRLHAPDGAIVITEDGGLVASFFDGEMTLLVGS